MSQNTFLPRLVAVAALLAAAGTAQAALSVYTSQASFIGALGATGVDSFNSLSLGLNPGTYNRTAGAYTYTATSKTSDDFGSAFFNAGTASDVWLSPDQHDDKVIFSNFSPAVRGVGGLFFNTDFAGSLLAGQSVTLVAVDSLGATLTQSISNPTASSFVGFVSDVALTSLTLTSTSVTVNYAWPSANNLTLGIAAVPVPEPDTYAMLLAGLVAVGSLARRRR